MTDQPNQVFLSIWNIDFQLHWFINVILSLVLIWYLVTLFYFDPFNKIMVFLSFFWTWWKSIHSGVMISSYSTFRLCFVFYFGFISGKEIKCIAELRWLLDYLEGYAVSFSWDFRAHTFNTEIWVLRKFVSLGEASHGTSGALWCWKTIWQNNL